MDLSETDICQAIRGFANNLSESLLLLDHRHIRLQLQLLPGAPPFHSSSWKRLLGTLLLGEITLLFEAAGKVSRFLVRDFVYLVRDLFVQQIVQSLLDLLHL